MNKALTKYGKTKWIDTRLSKKYKVRQFLRRSQASHVLAAAQAHVSAIAQSSASEAEKLKAIADCYFKANKAVLSIYKGEEA